MDCIAFGYKAWGFLGLGLGFFWHLTPRTFVKSFYYLSTDYFRRLKSSSPENVIFLTCIRKSVRCIKKSVEKYSPEENVDFSVWKTEIQNIFIYLLKYCYFKMPLWYTARDLVLPLYVSIHVYKHGFLYGHIFHDALKVFTLENSASHLLQHTAEAVILLLELKRYDLTVKDFYTYNTKKNNNHGSGIIYLKGQIKFITGSSQCQREVQIHTWVCRNQNSQPNVQYY